VRAGDWASSVPDLLVAEGRVGVRLGEFVQDARTDVEEAVAAACERDPWLRDHPASVEWFGGQFAPGRLPAGHPLLPLLTRTHEQVTGSSARVHGVPYGSDLRLLAEAGIPAVQYGPGDICHAHAPDERVALSELHTATEVLTLAILRSTEALAR